MKRKNGKRKPAPFTAKQVARLLREHQNELSDARDEHFARGFNAGSDAFRKSVLELLGLKVQP